MPSALHLVCGHVCVHLHHQLQASNAIYGRNDAEEEFERKMQVQFTITAIIAVQVIQAILTGGLLHALLTDWTSLADVTLNHPVPHSCTIILGPI